MTIPVREQTQNSAKSTLNGGINASTTTVVVADGSVFSSTGNFRVRVDNEIMKVTARSGNTLTVVRGQEGTTAASHANSAEVIQIISQEGFDALGKDNIGLFGWSSLLPLHKIVADDGTTLTASDFTWQNQGGATASDEDGTIVMGVPSSGTTNALRILERTAPSAPYAYVAAFDFAMATGGSPGRCDMFMGFRESSSSKLALLHIQCSNGGTGSGGTIDRHMRFAVLYWDNNSTRNATIPVAERLLMHIGPVLWIKIEDDNTNLKFYIGMDGVEWIQVASVTRTAHMAGAPDRVCWGANCPNNADNGMLVRLLHWSKGSNPPLKESYKSLAQDQLNGGIDSSQTTLTVNTGSVFPSTGNFRLLCDSEIMICTARSSNTLTVVRGQEGTTGASHANNAPIYHVATAGSIERIGKDYWPYWGGLERIHKISNDAGDGVLTVSDFTWDNQGSATATDEAGTIGLYCPPASGINWRVLYRSAPSTPYAYIGAFHMPCFTHDSSNAIRVSMGFRKSSTGQLHDINFLVGDSLESCLQVGILTSSTSFFTTQKAAGPALVLGAIWFKIEDDGTNLKFYLGLPGSTMHWLKVAEFSRTTYMTGGPDQVFFGVGNGNNNTNGFQARLVHWSKE
jgi:hypothetical protein